MNTIQMMYSRYEITVSKRVINKKFGKAQVNWQGCGNVLPEDAILYSSLLIKAAEIAAELDKEFENYKI